MGKKYKCIGKCIGVTETAKGLLGSAQVKLRDYIGENVYETNTVAHDGTMLVVFESNKRSMYHVSYLEIDERLDVSVNRAVLERERDQLQERARKLFESDLRYLCNKWGIDVTQYSSLKVSDRANGSEIESGFAYEDIVELIDWLEIEMGFRYQSILCNKDECLAH